MKKLMSRIWINRYFLVFILLFAYLQSVYLRVNSWLEINVYTFTPEAAISTFFKAGILFGIILYFLKRLPIQDSLKSRKLVWIFCLSIIVYLVLMKLLGFVIALAFDTVERNFNRHTFLFSLISDLLDGFIYGSFLFAYYYYRKSSTDQMQIARYNQALSESKISQLKAQLNPHFLFNNLNILDELILEDKKQASVFLNEFSEIYRYVLQASEKKFVRVEEELEFAGKYFNLIVHKFGTAYRLVIEGTSSGGYIVPLTIQLLIENAVQHNLGRSEAPVLISIDIGDSIVVSNNLALKASSKKTSGRGLKNLDEQYRLLSPRPVEIRQTDEQFLVIIPIIHSI